MRASAGGGEKRVDSGVDGGRRLLARTFPIGWHDHSLTLSTAPPDARTRAVGPMSFDRLEYRAEEAERRAEEAYHDLRDRHDAFLEREHRKHVSRRRFQTLVDRIRNSGAPYGAHTLVYRPSGELLLVRHEGVDMWVLPGGMTDGDESFREAAERELGEEAGLEVEYDGLGYLSRVEIRHAHYSTWGVLPVFEGRALSTEPEVTDPDGEISAARWFDELPADTRDRDDLLAWRNAAMPVDE